MKKILLSVCLLSVSLLASAQLTTSSDSKFTPTFINEWQGVRLSYEPTYLKFHDMLEDWSSRGCSFEYLRGYKVVEDMPIYFEYGAGLEWLNSSYSFVSSNNISKVERKKAINILFATIPANLGYKFTLNDQVTIMPYVGLKARVGILANLKGREYYEYVEDGETIIEEEKDSRNLFSGKEGIWGSRLKRLPLGWQAGVNVCHKNMVFGINHGACFTDELLKGEHDCKLSTTTISVGLNF